jgi:predicted alpha/beta-hydrolase family hydrolase
MNWTVQVGNETTSAIYDEGEGDVINDTIFVCAHGAGGNMVDGGMQKTSSALRSRGINLVRFNFLYKEKKSGRPDPMPKLIDCFDAVIEKTKAELNPGKIIIGGRSMGGRYCSLVAGDEEDPVAVQGLLLLGYPLHAAGKPEKERSDHFPRLTMPVAFVSGTRDSLAGKDALTKAAKTVKGKVTFHWLESADHGFRPLKASGLTADEVLADVASFSVDWVRARRG